MNYNKLAIFAVLLVALGCGNNQQKTPAGMPDPSQMVPNVEVATAVARDVPQESSYASTIQA